MASRTTLATAMALAVSLLCATGAHADSAALTVTDASGKSDPAAEIGRTFTVAGTATTPKRVFASYRPTGGAACAPSAATDSGTAPRYLPYGEEVDGAFAIKYTGIWPEAGTFLFCIWVADSSTAPVTPISQTITFRAPTASISAVVAPATPTVDQETTATVSGASEAPKAVFATYRPSGGAACAPTAESDSGRALPGVYGVDVNGAFRVSTRFTPSDPGDYVICVWVADYSGDPSPVAGPQAFPYSVVAPPPPCIVPTIAAGTPLATALTGLLAAHCTAGRQIYTASRRYARGSLVKLRTPAGTSLPNGGAVDLLISSGSPCVVPSSRKAITLRSARSRLRSAGCSAGKVRRVRSGRRRGRLVRFSPAAGRKLSPRAKVTIYLSRGR